MQIILRVITDLDLSKRSRLTAKMFQLHVIYCTILIFVPNTRIVWVLSASFLPDLKTFQSPYTFNTRTRLLKARFQKASRKTLRICSKNTEEHNPYTEKKYISELPQNTWYINICLYYLATIIIQVFYHRCGHLMAHIHIYIELSNPQASLLKRKSVMFFIKEIMGSKQQR